MRREVKRSRRQRRRDLKDARRQLRSQAGDKPVGGRRMSRTIWFAAGAGVGVYAMTRARRAAEAFTPDGLADRLAGLSLGLHLFRDEVRTGHGGEGKRRA